MEPVIFKENQNNFLEKLNQEIQSSIEKGEKSLKVMIDNFAKGEEILNFLKQNYKDYGYSAKFNNDIWEIEINLVIYPVPEEEYEQDA